MTDNVFSAFDFLWKLVERDMKAFLKGEHREMEQANIGRALGFGLASEIPGIREAWADARRLKAEREQHREGA